MVHTSSILAIFFLIIVIIIMIASFKYFISDYNPLPSGVVPALKGGSKKIKKFFM